MRITHNLMLMQMTNKRAKSRRNGYRQVFAVSTLLAAPTCLMSQISAAEGLLPELRYSEMCVFRLLIAQQSVEQPREMSPNLHQTEFSQFADMRN